MNSGDSARGIPEKLSEDEVREICAGNGDAITRMVNCYRDLARALCRKRGILWGFRFNDEEVEDIVQNVWIKVTIIRIHSFTQLD